MRPTVKVIMLQDAKGAPDSVTVCEYKAGQTYDIPEDLADCFFSTGAADPAEAHEAPAPTAPEVVAAEPPAPAKSRKAKA